MDMDGQIKTFEKQAEDYKKELYSKLKPSQKLQIARHPERPKFLDYVELLCEDFIEFHGDREGMDDRAIIGGIAFGFGPSRIAKEFTKGCEGMAGTTVIIGLGATVAVILTEGKTLDTVVMALASTLNVFPQFLRGVALLLINTIVNFFVVSGNGQAAVVMPVLTPACDLANISRQTCVFAFKMGDGFSNYIYPHCSSLMGFLSMAGIAWNKWMKFMGKLFGLWMLIGSLLLVMCYFVGY